MSDFDVAVTKAVYSNLSCSEAKKSVSVLAVMLGINMIAYKKFVQSSEIEELKTLLGGPVVTCIDSYINNYIRTNFTDHNATARFRVSICALWGKNATQETCHKLKKFIENCPMCIIFPDSECSVNNELQMVHRVSVNITKEHSVSIVKKKFEALKTRVQSDMIPVFGISYRACKCLQMLIDSYNTPTSALLGKQIEKECLPECPSCLLL